MRVETDVEPDVARVALVRRWARERLSDAGIDGHSLDLLALLVSECVTNAVLHAAPPLVLSIDVDADRTRVEVRDSAPGEPVLRRPEPTSPSGRGVMFIDRLSSRRGTVTHDDRADGDPAKTVWFELAHPVDQVAQVS
jgi:anti-sigma regulatory factor (Ser/Thr protein kinase)